MIKVSQSQLQTLASKSSSPCVSIYMPAEKAGAETRKNPIIFKNLLSEAQEKVAQLDSSSAITEAFDSAQSYIDNHDFWQHQDEGLVFFISPEGIEYYRLPYSFTQSVTVSDRFYLKPLLPLFTDSTDYYLLAISQNKVQLFSGNLHSLKALDLPNSIPPSLAEALKYDDPEKQIQYHSGDPGASPVYHGQGVGTTDNKDEIRRFLQQLNNGVQKAFAEDKTPLILAGVEYILAMYRELNSYTHLIEKGIYGNPDNMSTEDLQQQAKEIIQSTLESEKAEAIAKYQQLSATDESTDKIIEIIPAAVHGQIDTLFMVADAEIWGKFEAQTNKIDVYSEASDDSIDLLDYAATHTFLQGGKVYTLPADKMPENQSVVAILRYPVYAPASK